MKTQLTNFLPKIAVKKPIKNNPIIDIGLNDLNILKDGQSLAITMLFYPYTRDINSSNFKLLPYEEYVEEISDGGRTTYEIIDDFSDKLFGIILAVIIVSVFGLWQTELLFSVESVVAIIGAYIAGKELWGDVDNWLQKISKGWWFSWKDRDFYYQKLDFGSIQNYTRYSRNIRYGSAFVLPGKIDFVNQSSSKILELKFSQKELGLIATDSAHVVSLEYQKELEKTFVNNDYMLAVKLNIITNFLGLEINSEYFQSKDRNQIGCLDLAGNWLAGKSMLRKSFKIGNLKIYLETLIVEQNLFG